MGARYPREELVNKMSTQSGENGTLTCLLELSVGPPRRHCTPATPRVSDCERDAERRPDVLVQERRALRETKSEVEYILGTERLNTKCMLDGGG